MIDRIKQGSMFFLLCTSFIKDYKFFQYIVDDDESKEWKLYDAGPKQVKCPLVCFPPASGTADVFYKQVLALSAVGFRVISVRVTFV